MATSVFNNLSVNEVIVDWKEPQVIWVATASICNSIYFHRAMNTDKDL